MTTSRSIASIVLLFLASIVSAGGIDNSKSDNFKYFFGIGTGEGGGAHGGSFTAYRLSYQKIITQNEKYGFDYISDTAFNFWKDDSRLSNSDKQTATSSLDTSNISISHSKVIRKYVIKNTFFDLGLGISLHNNDSMNGSDLGSYYQLETRIGLGYERQTYRSILNFFHYSNGGLKGKNDGIDIVMLSISKYF